MKLSNAVANPIIATLVLAGAVVFKALSSPQFNLPLVNNRFALQGGLVCLFVCIGALSVRRRQTIARANTAANSIHEKFEVILGLLALTILLISVNDSRVMLQKMLTLKLPTRSSQVSPGDMKVPMVAARVLYNSREQLAGKTVWVYPDEQDWRYQPLAYYARVQLKRLDTQPCLAITEEQLWESFETAFAGTPVKKFQLKHLMYVLQPQSTSKELIAVVQGKQVYLLSESSIAVKRQCS